MCSHVPLKELQRRVHDARMKVTRSEGISTKGKVAAAIAIVAFFIVSIVNTALPKDKYWIGLISLVIELTAWLFFAAELRSILRTGSSKQMDWLDEYDNLAVEDGQTVEWIATFDRDLVIRSIETLNERSLGEDVGFSMLFGAAGKLGLLVVLGVAYTQVTALTSVDMTRFGVLIRVLFGVIIIVMYVLSWPITLQTTRRDRLKMMLEFGLARIERTDKTSEESAQSEARET